MEVGKTAVEPEAVYQLGERLGRVLQQLENARSKAPTRFKALALTS